MPDTKAKVGSNKGKSFLDRASIAIARRMYDDGSDLHTVAEYTGSCTSYMLRLFKEFERGQHAEPLHLRAVSSPVSASTKTSSWRRKLPSVKARVREVAKPVAASTPKKAVKPAVKPVSVSATKAPPPIVAPVQSPAKYKKHHVPTKDKKMPVKPEQALSAVKANKYTGLKKCPTEGCTNRIKAKDLDCPDCYHLSLVGRPPVHKSVQYVGGLLK